jgi:BirA family biotin operon repressor/biotin-[acetyl-CoA-carboxylase] ligase
MASISKIFYYDNLASTNEAAKTIDEDNILIITDNQNSGKGRMGRKWVSEKDTNLTFTIKKKIDINAKDIQCINYFITYYTLIGIEDYIVNSMEEPFKIEIMWPNDIYVNSKKISGILIENIFNDSNFIIGIGINVNQRRFDPKFSHKTTSLFNILKKECDINELLVKLLTIYDNHMHLLIKRRYDEIFDNWKAKCNMIDNTILISDIKNKEIEAYVKDLLYEGGIKLQVSDKEKVYYCGDIRVLSKNDKISPNPIK